MGRFFLAKVSTNAPVISGTCKRFVPKLIGFDCHSPELWQVYTSTSHTCTKLLRHVQHGRGVTWVNGLKPAGVTPNASNSLVAFHIFYCVQ